jgi:putative drug exporter of the RND superfamily
MVHGHTMRQLQRAHPDPTDDTSRKPGWLARLGGWCFGHRLAAVGLWVFALILVFGAAGAVGPAYEETFDVPGSDSSAGFAVLNEHFAQLGTGGQSGTIVFRADQGIDDPQVTAAMGELFVLVDAGFPDEHGVAQNPGATVVSPYSAEGGGQIARNGSLAGHLAYAQVNLSADVDMTEGSQIGAAIAEHAPRIDGLEVLAGGRAFAEAAVPKTELIGIAFAVVVLILAFGSVLAMGLPLAVALAGVGAGVGLIGLLSNFLTVPDYTTTVALMIGLGVGIDYALFIVVRYREGIHEGRSPRAATMRAMDTAGRAVVFAGLTVVLSLLGILLIGLASLSGLAIGASTTVLVTMISSLTLLPALLGLAGPRVEVTRWRGLLMAGGSAVALLGLGIGVPPLAAAGAALAVFTLLASFVVRSLRRPVPSRPVKPLRETFAYRWSRSIQRHPARWLVTGAVIMLVLASPILGLRLGFSDEGNAAEGTATRSAYDLLADGFGDGFNGPFIVTVESGDGASIGSVAAVHDALAAAPGVATVTEPIVDDPADPHAAIMTLIATTAPQDEATTELVVDLRNEVIPAAVAGSGLEVSITGTAAVNVDSTDYLGGKLLLFFGSVLMLSFLLLMVVFRSVLVPLKAVIMNILSIGAAFGVVVAVFQWGWFGGLFGIAGAPIEAPFPMILFAIVFGVSMDYEVFLLSRVREEYTKTGDAGRSVADGLASTARVITAAAAIMIVVFGSFVLEADRGAKLFGFSLALAIFLDATLVRMLLVPATMELLGSKNWWMPKWLDRMLPKISVEGTGHYDNDAAIPDLDDESDDDWQEDAERESVNV